MQYTQKTIWFFLKRISRTVEWTYKTVGFFINFYREQGKDLRLV